MCRRSSPRSSRVELLSKTIILTPREGNIETGRFWRADIVKFGEIGPVERGDGHVLHGCVEPPLLDQAHHVDDFRVSLQIYGVAELLCEVTLGGRITQYADALVRFAALRRKSSHERIELSSVRAMSCNL